MDATNNRIGIGTTNPTAKLDVRGDSESTSDMVGARIYNTNITTNSQSGIGFFNYDNFSAKIYSPRSGSPAGTIAFGTNNGNGIAESNVIERARITSTGQFLVNTTTGYGRFTVQSGAGTGKVLLDNYATVPTTENVMSIYADATNGYIQSYNNAYKNISIAPYGGNLLVGDTFTNLTGARATIMGSGGLAVQFGAATGTYLLVTPGGADGPVELKFDARSGDYPPATFKLGNSERMRITSAGDVGIGTTAPTSRLTVSSASGAVALNVTNVSVDGSTADVMQIQPSNGAYYGKLLKITSGRSDYSDSLLFLNTTTGMNSTNGSYLRVQNSSSADIFRIKGDGSVGIGVTAPNVKLDVVSGDTNAAGDSLTVQTSSVTGPNLAFTHQVGVFNVATNTAADIDVGGSIGFGGRWSSNVQAGFAVIKGAKENAGVNYASYLAFYTRPDGAAMSERMRINSAGHLLVGTTALTGSTSNSKKIVGGNFSSFNGEITSALTNTYYTMFDTGADYGCFIVSVIGYAADAANYSTTAIVNIQNTSVSISYIDTGGLIFITNSGTTIRVNQNSGNTMGAIAWSALRLI